MGALNIILIDPHIQIGLQFFDCSVNLLAKRNRIELLFYRFMKTLTDAISLRIVCFGLGMINVFNGQIQLINGYRRDS